MKVLALEKELSHPTPEAYQPFLLQEAARVWELQQAGVIREAYFQAGQYTAVLVVECEDASAAREALQTLPLVKAGLIDFEIIPLVAYSGFMRLFSVEANAALLAAK
jgi:muconolactone delta-isomerase